MHNKELTLEIFCINIILYIERGYVYIININSCIYIPPIWRCNNNEYICPFGFIGK